MTRTTSSTLIAAAIFLVAFTATQAIDILEEKWAKNPLVRNPASLVPLREDVKKFGCEINICFVLDGTKQVTPDQFLLQKNFADLIMAITTTDSTAFYCGVHYNDFFTRISPRTKNPETFLKRLYKAEQIHPQKNRVNVARGFRYVVNQLLDRGRVANKVVLFSKGGRGLGKQPRNISNYFQRNKGGVCGVVVGDGSTEQLQKLTPGIVVNFDGFFELSEVVVAIVSDLCGMPCGEGAQSC